MSSRIVAHDTSASEWPSLPNSRRGSAPARDPGVPPVHTLVVRSAAASPSSEAAAESPPWGWPQGSHVHGGSRDSSHDCHPTWPTHPSTSAALVFSCMMSSTNTGARSAHDAPRRHQNTTGSASMHSMPTPVLLSGLLRVPGWKPWGRWLSV